MCFLPAILVAPAANASYELLLTCDYQLGRISRWDPVTGMNLGSFGQGTLLSPAKIAVNKAIGVAYVTDYQASTVSAWNYSTGAPINDFVVNGVWGIEVLGNGNLLIGTGSGARIYSPTGTLVQNITSSTSYGVGYDGTNIYVGNGSSLGKYTMGGTLISSVSTGSHLIYQMAFRNGVGYLSGVNGLGKVGILNTSSMSFSQVIVSGMSGDLEAVSLGHLNRLYVGGTLTASSNQGFARTFLNGSQYGSFGAGSFGTRISGSAIIVAPEPSSLAILALGAGCWLARRRRT